ncbi:tail completion protein R (GpR) [Paraburkholderia eburnea]|uniref:Tail completion protein R (GpR) n=1 Tax=Paraburkholderia eburnea TaxID=1189126 RepID=A0A2S4LWC1_9BURK|nr:phage tail protein [Paraburkholderia eburnea]POR46744.1 tail completion protein R (GpR) [Paraburkholderia eburnea]PRZ17933.1 tail completion protein R (GpR) [Paraburkholderia eburnea]
MKKPVSLRAAITAALPDLATNPDKLTVHIDAGVIEATGGLSASFEYRYTCNVILLDFAGDADLLFIAINEWARRYQVDLLNDPEARANGITFEVDILSDTLSDVSIKLQLTESVVVGVDAAGNRTIDHIDDSIMPDHTITSVAEPIVDPDALIVRSVRDGIESQVWPT